MPKNNFLPNLNPLLIKSKDIPVANKGPFKNIRNSIARASVRKYNQTIMNTQNAPIMQGILSAENIAKNAILVNATKGNSLASKAANSALEKYNTQITGGQTEDKTENEDSTVNRIH